VASWEGGSYQELQASTSDEHPLSGVGDEAFFSYSADTAGGLAGFRVGATVVVVGVGARSSTGAIPAKSQVLAAAAARRI